MNNTGLLVWVTLYAYNIFFIISKLGQIDDNSVSFKIFNVMLTALCIFVFLKFLAQRRYIKKNELLLIFGLIIFILLYYTTELRYGNTNSDFISYFLNMGVRVVPAFFLGYILCNKDNFNNLLKWMLPFVISMTIFIIFSITTSLMDTNTVAAYNYNGLTYQGISYMAVYMASFTLFIIKYFDIIPKFKIFSGILWKTVSYILLIFQILAFIISGGRGAAILLIVIILYNFLEPKNLPKGVFILALLYVGFNLFFENIADTAGLNRIMSLFTESLIDSANSRIAIQTTSFESFLESPLLGHGFGSVFYEVGIYSHNIILDWLCESGIVGTIMFVILFLYITGKLIKLTRNDYKIKVIAIIFITSIVRLMFSGYYLADMGIWLTLAFTLNFKREFEK